MNEELQKKLVELINGAQKAGTEAFLFTKEQVPDVIQQLLVWKLTQGLLQGILGLIALTLVGVFLFKIWFPDVKKDFEGNPGIQIGGGVAALVISIFGFVGAIEGFSVALKIWLAPKIFLIEYAATLIKK